MRPGPAPVHEVQSKRFATCQKMIAEKAYLNTWRISDIEKIVFHSALRAYVLIYPSYILTCGFILHIRHITCMYMDVCFEKYEETCLSSQLKSLQVMRMIRPHP